MVEISKEMKDDELQRHLIQFRCINYLTSYSLTKEAVQEIQKDLDSLIDLLPSRKNIHIGEEKEFNIFISNNESDEITVNKDSKTITFTLAVSCHTADGKRDNLDVAHFVYSYNTNEWYQIVMIDRTFDYKHRITIQGNGRSSCWIQAGEKWHYSKVKNLLMTKTV